MMGQAALDAAGGTAAALQAVAYIGITPLIAAYAQCADSSDASFQRAFMDIPGQYPMKLLYTQGVRTYTSLMGGKQERVRSRRVTPARPTAAAVDAGRAYP